MDEIRGRLDAEAIGVGGAIKEIGDGFPIVDGVEGNEAPTLLTPPFERARDKLKEEIGFFSEIRFLLQK